MGDEPNKSTMTIFGRNRHGADWFTGLSEPAGLFGGGGGYGGGAGGGDGGVDGGVKSAFFDHEFKFFAALGVGERNLVAGLQLVGEGPAFLGELFVVELDDGHEAVLTFIDVFHKPDAGGGREAGA